MAVPASATQAQEEEAMTIEQIKDECQKAILWAERAENGPWRAVLTGDSYHIAHARTFAPAAARSLLTCIDALEKECAKFRFPDEDRPILQDALAAICAQFDR